jgi:NTE family protein
MAEQARSRALVLGGGGPVGVGWEIGLAAGLATAGVDLTNAGTIIGTSAGSITGAKLAGGADIDELVASSGSLFERSAANTGADKIPDSAMGQLFELMMASADDAQSSTDRLAAVGALALTAETIPEEAFVSGLRSEFGDEPWPERYACTAVDAGSGEFVVWDESADVPLHLAIASSCSVPAIYPPVTINERRYVDGGMRSALNADLAAGHDAVIVVSCMPLELPPFLDDPRILNFFARERESIETLRASGAAVEVIVPDEEFLTISGMGMSLMDFSRVQTAADAGVRLGKQEAERLAAIW